MNPRGRRSEGSAQPELVLSSRAWRLSCLPEAGWCSRRVTRRHFRRSARAGTMASGTGVAGTRGTGSDMGSGPRGWLSPPEPDQARMPPPRPSRNSTSAGCVAGSSGSGRRSPWSSCSWSPSSLPGPSPSPTARASPRRSRPRRCGRNPAADSDAADLARRALLTPEGRELLYATSPQVVGDAVTQACARPSDRPGDEIVAVGCYAGGWGPVASSSSALRPTTRGLDGDDDCDELLHAAYDRMNAVEHARIDALLAAETARLPADDPTRKQIDWSVGGAESNRGTEQFAYLAPRSCRRAASHPSSSRSTRAGSPIGRSGADLSRIDGRRGRPCGAADLRMGFPRRRREGRRHRTRAVRGRSRLARARGAAVQTTRRRATTRPIRLRGGG